MGTPLRPCVNTGPRSAQIAIIRSRVPVARGLVSGGGSGRRWRGQDRLPDQDGGGPAVCGHSDGATGWPDDRLGLRWQGRHGRGGAAGLAVVLALMLMMAGVMVFVMGGFGRT